MLLTKGQRCPCDWAGVLRQGPGEEARRLGEEGAPL